MEGNIIIHKENVPFEMVAKALINDESIDALTLGIYVKILGLNPEKWNLNITGLSAKLNISCQKIKTAFAILERTGYLRRVHAKNEAGRYVGYDYHIANVPFPESQRTNVVAECSRNEEKPAIGKSSSWKNQQLEKPAAGKSGGIIINREGNSKPTSKSHTQSNNPLTPSEGFTAPTVEEVAAYAQQQGFADPSGFAAYYVAYQTEAGWTTGKGSKKKPIDNWKLNVLAWGKYRKNETFSPQGAKPAVAPIAIDRNEFEQLFR